MCQTCGSAFKKSPFWDKLYERPYCSRQCRYADKALSRRLIEKARQQMLERPSRLELDGYALLARMGIPFERQRSFGDFVVDVFIETANLVIQFDGDYWHGHPRFALDERMKRRRRLDRWQDQRLGRLGIQVLRIWESDFRTDPEDVQVRIADALHSTR